jgi:serine/threonine-protein kinase
MSETKPAAGTEPSEIAGRYQVVQKLGAGAFGTVYKAKDRILGRMVAIKTIRLEGLAAAAAGLDELMRRFKQEAQVAAQLKHPSIVTIYDIGEENDLSYLAMEFIDGVGLDKVIAAEGRLPAERAASLAAQVADALDFAHRNHVVHRDIKPANIMIEAGDRVKVTDFGIAKPLDSGEHLTVTGSLLGTPSYMSPEQARGGALDGRSDLFAVGCILYEMVTGKKAFRGESITALIFKIITEDPTPVRELDPQVPEGLIRIIAKALAKTPEARYQTGKELVDDLLSLTRPGTIPTLRQIELPTVVPGSEPTAMATVSTAPTAAGPASATRVTPPTRVSPPVSVSPPPPKPAPPRVAAPPRPAVAPRRSGSLAVVIGLLVVLAGGGAAAWYFLVHKKAATEGTSTATGSTVASTTLPAPTESPKEVEPTPEPTSGGPSATDASGGATDSTEPAGGGATTGPGTTGGAGTTGGGASEATAGRTSTGSTAGAGLPAGGASRRDTASGGTERPATARDFSFLDDLPPEPQDSGDSGSRLADAYRSRQGGASSGYGVSGRRFSRRERIPRNVALGERPAVAALAYVMNSQEIFKKTQKRYGSFEELQRARLFNLDVPIKATEFLRRNYRIELTVKEDGYTALAIPLAAGLRPFVVDESGFIRQGTE